MAETQFAEPVDLGNDMDLLSGDVAEPKDKSAPIVEEEEVEEQAGSDKAQVHDEEEPEVPESDEEETVDEQSTNQPLYDRPTVKAIKEKYPNLFKDFPSLNHMYAREREFSKLFPTVQIAKDTAENAASFAEFSDEILSGSPTKLFKATQEADPEAMTRLAGKLLPELYKLSPDLHWKATLPLMENIVRSAYAEGVKTKNDNLKHAAGHLAQWLLDDANVATGRATKIETEQEPSEKDKKLSEREQALLDSQMATFSTPVKADGLAKLDKMITSRADGTDSIDPKGVLSPAIKKMVIDKIRQEVQNQMDADTAHIGYMNSLWVEAKDGGFSDAHKTRILNAFLARARALVPTVRARIVSEAMGTSSRVNGNKQEQVERTSSRREPNAQGGRDTRERASVPLAKAVDWGKTSDMDFLSDKATLKK